MQSGQSAGSGESMAAKRARFEQLALPAAAARGPPRHLSRRERQVLRRVLFDNP